MGLVKAIILLSIHNAPFFLFFLEAQQQTWPNKPLAPLGQF